MTDKELIAKADSDEGLTVEEIQRYETLVKPKKQVYGKYGTLALRYLEEYNVGKLWCLAGELPAYLHGIDRQAEEAYDILYEKLSKNPQFARTGDYLTDVRRINQIKQIIEETILTKIVYV